MDGFYLKPLSAEILRELLEKFLWTPPTATPGLDNLTTDDGSTGETSGQTRISKAPKAPSVTKAAHGVRSPSDRSIKAPSVAASAIAALPGTMAAPELTFTAATDTNTPAESEREV